MSPFRDVKVHVVTYEGHGDAANFVVYTAIVTTTFLTRFMLPHKDPGPEDTKTGMEISYTRVRIWPMLGLNERLAKALGPEIAGGPVHDDPDHIGFWDPLVKPPPPLTYLTGLQPQSASFVPVSCPPPVEFLNAPQAVLRNPTAI